MNIPRKWTPVRFVAAAVVVVGLGYLVGCAASKAIDKAAGVLGGIKAPASVAAPAALNEIKTDTAMVRMLVHMADYDSILVRMDNIDALVDSLSGKIATTSNHGFISTVAYICIAGGALALVLSFVPALRLLIPKVAAIVAILTGIGLIVLQAVLVKLLGPAVWVVGIAGGIAALPWVWFAFRWSLDRVGKKLAGKEGHADAGLALRAAARGLVGDDKKSKDKRKEVLAKLTGASTP